MAVRYGTYHFTSLFVSVTTSRHLSVIIAVAELLQATGGRMEQMEEQMGQMSEMQMSFSSAASDFSFPTQLQRVSQGLSRTLEGGYYGPRKSLPSSSATLSSAAHSITGQGIKGCLLEYPNTIARHGKVDKMVKTRWPIPNECVVACVQLGCHLCSRTNNNDNLLTTLHYRSLP